MQYSTQQRSLRTSNNKPRVNEQEVTGAALLMVQNVEQAQKEDGKVT